MITFSASCVPIEYRLTFTGDATLLNSMAGDPIDVTFASLVVDVDDSANPATFSISGGFTSSCFGGAATVSTQQALAVNDDEVCPRAGELTAAVGANSTKVFFRSNSNVEFDLTNDGSVDPPTYPHCQDPRLYECLA
jgi:hypothetical protein